MRPPRVGSAEFKAKVYWEACFDRAKDRLRTAESRYANYSTSDLKALWDDKQKEAASLAKFLDNFTSREDQQRVSDEARSLYTVNGTHPNSYVIVENRRCLAFSKNKNSVTSGTLKDMAIEGHSAVLALQSDVFFQTLGTCIKIHDDGNYLEFQPFNTELIKHHLSKQARYFEYEFSTAGRGYSGWFSERHELTDDEKLERFKTRVLHVSEVNKYHQIYDRGIALGPSDIRRFVVRAAQAVHDLELVIYRRENSKK